MILFSKLKYFIISLIQGSTISKKIAKYYFGIIVVGAILLLLPITHKDGQGLNLIDAFFTAASAFSDTGLTVVSTIDTFNFLGQAVILLLIQVGGIGIMSIKVLLFVLIGKRLNFGDRLLIHKEQGQTHVGGMIKFLKNSLFILLAFEFIFVIVLTVHMIVNYQYQFDQAIWFGFFHTISAINNAGFDIMGNTSFSMFSNDYLFQSYIMILIIIGGVGFPVLNDIVMYFQAKRKKERFRFSLFTKLSVTTYFSVAIVGFIVILLIESNNLFSIYSVDKSIMSILFHVISSRNAGFATMDLNIFSEASQMVIAILMFVGAAPASTGGGIRTTTFAIIILFLISFSRNKEDVEVFSRRIPRKTILNSFITLTFAIMVIFTTSLIVIVGNENIPVNAGVFEAFSAFGTTGLSLGITTSLDSFGRLFIAILMIIGQLGISGTLLMFASKKHIDKTLQYPEEDITIG